MHGITPGVKTDLYYTPTGVGKSVHLFVVIDRERHSQTNRSIRLQVVYQGDTLTHVSHFVPHLAVK